jgi:hypothetical protein
MPSVVNIFTSKEVKLPRHPFMDDPLFRRFFGDQYDAETQRSSSLGSGVIVGTEDTFSPIIMSWKRPMRSRSRSTMADKRGRARWAQTLRPISQC